MTHANDFQKLQNHLALTSSNTVAGKMLPCLIQHNISFFYFHREYTDGSVITLSSNESWTRHMFQKGYITNKRNLIIPEHLIKPVNYFLWLPHMYPEKITDAAINFDIANVIDISIRNDNYIDYFGYGARVRDNHIFNYYLSHLDTLENISRSFLCKADSLIADYEKDKIIPIEDTRKDVISENDKPLLSLSEHAPHFIERHMKNKIALPKSQYACARLLLQGLKYREIAAELKLSLRTVESYVEILKNKMRCRNKGELIIKLIDVI